MQLSIRLLLAAITLAAFDTAAGLWLLKQGLLTNSLQLGLAVARSLSADCWNPLCRLAGPHAISIRPSLNRRLLGRFGSIRNLPLIRGTSWPMALGKSIIPRACMGAN